MTTETLTREDRLLAAMLEGYVANRGAVPRGAGLDHLIESAEVIEETLSRRDRQRAGDAGQAKGPVSPEPEDEDALATAIAKEVAAWLDEPVSAEEAHGGAAWCGPRKVFYRRNIILGWTIIAEAPTRFVRENRANTALLLRALDRVPGWQRTRRTHAQTDLSGRTQEGRFLVRADAVSGLGLGAVLPFSEIEEADQ